MQSLPCAHLPVQPGQTVPVTEPRTAPPTWFVVLLGLGLAVLVAGLSFFALQALGVEAVGGGFVLVICLLAAVVGGFLARTVAARLPPLGRPR